MSEEYSDQITRLDYERYQKATGQNVSMNGERSETSGSNNNGQPIPTMNDFEETIMGIVAKGIRLGLIPTEPWSEEKIKEQNDLSWRVRNKSIYEPDGIPSCLKKLGLVP